MASSPVFASSQNKEVEVIDFTLHGPTSCKHNIANARGWVLDMSFPSQGTANGFGSFGAPPPKFSVALNAPKSAPQNLARDFEAKLILSGSITTSTSWKLIRKKSNTVIFSTSESIFSPFKPHLEGTLLLRFDQDSDPRIPLRIVSDHLTEGGAPDVEILVFSKHRNGGASAAKQLFGREPFLLGKSHELDALISSDDFATHEECPAFVDAATYGYASDSDLEEADEALEDEDALKAGVAINNGEDGVDTFVPESATAPEEQPDFAAQDVVSQPEVAEEQAEHLEATTASPSTRNKRKRIKRKFECSRPHATFKRSIVIRDGAFITWYSLLYYVYTGHIAFAPLQSSGAEERKKFVDDYVRKNPHRPPPCSPKSMLRLADKYGLRNLEDLALKELGSRLTTKNIVVEYFSTFTLTYEKVQKAEFLYLREHLQTAEVKEAWKRHTVEILGDPEMLALYHSASTKLLFPGDD